MVSHSYRSGVDWGLTWAYVVMIVVFATSALVVAVAAGARVDPGLWGAIVAFVILAVVEAWRVAHVRLAAVDVAAMTAVAVWLQVAWATDPQAPFGPGQRVMATIAVVFGARMFASRGQQVIALVSAIGAQVSTDAVRIDPLAAVAGAWPVVAAGIAIWVCVPAMRKAAGRADAAGDDQQRLSAAAAAAAGARRARIDVQSVLHDDIVSALRAVSLPEVSDAEARLAARAAVAAIERTPAPDDDANLLDLAQLIGSLPPVPGTVTTFRPGERFVVPGTVALASVAAATEALRNVARHAHARHVQVTLDRDGAGFALVIDDDGIGFQPTEAMDRSHGLRHSVVRRITEIGGRADVSSTPGRGTSVRIEWQPTISTQPREPTRPERLAAALGDVRLPLAAVCVPYLAMTAVFAIRYTVDGLGPWWLLAWLAGLEAITLVVLARAHTGLSGPIVGGSLVYGVAGTVASLFVLPADALRDYSSWPLGAIASLLAVVIIVRPLWEASVALLILQAAIVAVTLAGQFGSGPWTTLIAAVTPAALSTVEPVVFGLVVGQAVLKLGDIVTRANAARRAAAAAESTLRAREVVHRRRLTDMNEEVLPFLRGVATGETGPTADGVRELARALEHAARDELHIPGVLDATSRDLMRRARDAGSIITIQSAGTDIAPPRLVRDLLATALSRGAPPRELILSIEPNDIGVTVNLVTIPGDGDRAARLRSKFGRALTVLDDSPAATWVEAVVTLDPAARTGVAEPADTSVGGIYRSTPRSMSSTKMGTAARDRPPSQF